MTEIETARVAYMAARANAKVIASQIRGIRFMRRAVTGRMILAQIDADRQATAWAVELDYLKNG